MEKLRLVPNGNRVVVKLDTDTGKTAGGLFIPQTSEKSQRTGTVVDASPSYITPAGKTDTVFSAGDRVLIDVIVCTTVEIEGEHLYIVRNEDIIGRFILS